MSRWATIFAKRINIKTSPSSNSPKKLKWEHYVGNQHNQSRTFQQSSQPSTLQNLPGTQSGSGNFPQPPEPRTQPFAPPSQNTETSLSWQCPQTRLQKTSCKHGNAKTTVPNRKMFLPCVVSGATNTKTWDSATLCYPFVKTRHCLEHRVLVASIAMAPATFVSAKYSSNKSFAFWNTQMLPRMFVLDRSMTS